MKYEITKGSEKDFRGLGDDVMRVLKSSTGTFIYADAKSHIGPHWELIAERRPITEPVVNQQLTTEWDGCGLPPVGAECEVKRVAEWLPVKIEFISDTNTIFTTRGGTEECYHTHSLKFRPIRSAEDVAREKAVNEMEKITSFHLTSDANTFSAIRALYDAGYRRPKPHADEVQECEHTNTRPTSGGCICNDCGWRSW